VSTPELIYVALAKKVGVIVLRIVPKESEAKLYLEKGQAPPPTVSKTVVLGKEDTILAITIGLILLGVALGQLTIKDALEYFGLSAAGGVWGLLGGHSSSK